MLGATSGTRRSTSRISVPFPAPDGPVTTITDVGLAIEELGQLGALAIGEAADGLRLTDPARVEEARRLHTPELRYRHQDVDDLCRRHVLGRIVEDRLDSNAPVLEVLFQLRAPYPNVVRSLQRVHPLVEGPKRSMRLRLRGRRHERRYYQRVRDDQASTKCVSCAAANTCSRSTSASSERTRGGASGSEKRTVPRATSRAPHATRSTASRPVVTPPMPTIGSRVAA